MKKIPLLLLLCLATLFIRAQSGRIFYIDFVNGSNANDGTAKTLSGGHGPWKSHPYMLNSLSCGGTLPGYTHQAGDRFIFKGGVTWPVNCFAMNIPFSGSGTPSAQDYYGVDKSWFAGAAFTKPLWDMAFLTPSGNVVVTGAVTTHGFGYITFDNIEIAHQAIILPSGNNSGQAFSFENYSLASDSPVGIIISNCFLHDWGITSQLTSTNQPGYSAGTAFGNVTVDGCEISNANGFHFVGGVRTAASKLGGAVVGVTNNAGQSIVRNSKIHDTMAACFNVRSCHDNEFYNQGQPTGDPGGASVHSQVIEDDDGWGPTDVYNNLIHDENAGVVIDVCQGASVYNNVIYNNSNNFGIRLAGTGGGSCGSAIINIPSSIHDNTLDCSGSAPTCFGTDSHTGAAVTGNVNLQNNIYITNSPANAVSINEPITGTFTNNHNYPMPTAEASSHGYTIANKYAATVTDANTVAAGVNLTGSCLGHLSQLCFDTEGAPWYAGTFQTRPTGSTAWDLGAYVFHGPLAPILALSPNPAAFGNQNVSTTSVPLTVTITNTGSANEVLSTPYFTITTGNSGDFKNTGGSASSGATITPGGSLTWIGTFTPSTVGAENSLLTIVGTVNGTDSLTGTGTSVPIPVVTLVPRTINFGTINTGASSGNQLVTLTNSGTATLTYSSIASSDAIQFPLNISGLGSPCTLAGSTLAAGASCTFNVTFAPTAAGIQNATVTVLSNASSSPDTVALTGTGFTQPVNPPSAPAPVILVAAPLPPQPVVSGLTQIGSCVMNDRCAYSLSCLANCSSNTLLYIDKSQVTQTYVNGGMTFFAKLSAGIHSYLAVNVQ